MVQSPEVYELEQTEDGQGRIRPAVTLKYAQTLDGRIATSTGHSRWISGPEARALAHRLRAEHDAVLVGIGTVLADDPQLTVRLAAGPDPLKVIVDSRLRTPPAAAALSSGSGRTLIATTPGASPDRRLALEEAGAEILEIGATERGVDLRRLLYRLRDLGVSSLLVEGGAGIITSVLRHRLVDRLVVVVAPKVIGAGVDAVGELGIDRIDRALTLGDRIVETVGHDIVFRGTIRWPSE